MFSSFFILIAYPFVNDKIIFNQENVKYKIFMGESAWRYKNRTLIIYNDYFTFIRLHFISQKYHSFSNFSYTVVHKM